MFSVTIARAIEMKHSSSIISSLGYETAKIFQEAGKLKVKAVISKNYLSIPSSKMRI